MTLNDYIMSSSDFVPAVLFFWRSAPLWVWGRCKLSSGVWGGALAEIKLGAFLALK